MQFFFWVVLCLFFIVLTGKMGTTLLSDMAFGILPRYAMVSPGGECKQVSDFCVGRRLVCFRAVSKRKKSVNTAQIDVFSN